jgi:small subunit ribosomal protein S2
MAAKEEDVEDVSTDDNEKKAARLQAEAEAEAARARGEKVRGGGHQPKRRIPNSPRRTGAR